MRLLVYEPADCHPRNIEVDGPPADSILRQAVGGEIEDVPAFNSISYEGVVHRCVAFCNDRLLVVGAIAVLGTPRPNFERH